MIALKANGYTKRPLVEKAAFGANLIGVDRLVFEAERHVQNIDIALCASLGTHSRHGRIIGE